VEIQKELEEDSEGKVNKKDPIVPLFIPKAHPYCLRAQVWEAQKQLEDAKKDWELCYEIGDPSDPEVDIWSHIAEQRK